MKITNGMTLGGEKKTHNAKKKRWALGLFYEAQSILEKGMNTTNGMTLGGPKETTMLTKGHGYLVYSRKFLRK
jgi:hypothetical protein